MLRTRQQRFLCPTWMIYWGAEVPSKARDNFNSMATLLQNLNIPISKSKLTAPTTKINCLGIEVDSVKATLSIPTEKLHEILQKCIKFKNQKQFSRRQLQSVIGKLMFVHKVIKPARVFVNRLLEKLRSMKDKASMSTEILNDIVNISVTKDHILATMCRNIWLETAMKDINFKLIHIPGKDNGCADLLSRWHLVHNNWQKLAQYARSPQWCTVNAEHLCLNLEIKDCMVITCILCHCRCKSRLQSITIQSWIQNHHCTSSKNHKDTYFPPNYPSAVSPVHKPGCT